MEPWSYKPAADHGLSEKERFRSLRREVGLGAYLTQGSWRAVVRVYLRLYHRLEIIGTEHLPAEPPFVLVANHSSHLDAITLAAALPWRLRQSVFPIAAGDVFFETPVAAIFSAMMLNGLPMWRRRCGSHALHELRERLIGEPAIYLLFPEGTRSRDGAMGAFKPGIGMLVAGTSVPVVPCHLAGAHAAFPPTARLPRPGRLTLRIGVPLTFSEAADEREGWRSVAGALAGAVGALGAGRKGAAGERSGG